MTSTNQTDIFSMFGLVDELAEKKKKEAAEKQAKEQAQREAREAELKAKVEAARESKGAESAEKAVSAKKEEVFKLNADTIIRYYGTSYPVTNYFNAEELEEGLLVKRKDADDERKPLDAEMLRKRMEKEFPEMVKSHTEMIYLEDKNIVLPTMKAKKKGMNEEALSNDSTSSSLPKIPFVLLQQFIGLAKFYGTQHLEVHGDIYYNYANREYFLDVPAQVVNPYWVEVSEDSRSIVSRVLESRKVLEIHSHHSMPPIPSNQDDVSETLPGMVYAIVGYTHSYFPSVTIRQYISDSLGHVSLDIRDYFADPFQELPSTELIEVKL
ncbi:MAG: hypothetical protein R3267_06540 [Paenisporosarcina sp.]|nr:hypothetical protein [Paenisporosarcina sp.]